MRISFADSPPAAIHALAIVVAPGTLDGAGLSALPQPVQQVARAAATGNRFDGENGAVIEFFNEVETVNRSLDQVHAAFSKGEGAAMEREFTRALIKARHLVPGNEENFYDHALAALALKPRFVAGKLDRIALSIGL